MKRASKFCIIFTLTTFFLPPLTSPMDCLGQTSVPESKTSLQHAIDSLVTIHERLLQSVQSDQVDFTKFKKEWKATAQIVAKESFKDTLRVTAPVFMILMADSIKPWNWVGGLLPLVAGGIGWGWNQYRIYRMTKPLDFVSQQTALLQGSSAEISVQQRFGQRPSTKTRLKDVNALEMIFFRALFDDSVTEIEKRNLLIAVLKERIAILKQIQQYPLAETAFEGTRASEAGYCMVTLMRFGHYLDCRECLSLRPVNLP